MPQLEIPHYSASKSETARHTIHVEFDGGTSCNIPRLGYGDGYGSYIWYDEAAKESPAGPIVRVKFHRPMSANVAEISTLIRALHSIATTYNPITTALNIHGDSMIALSRCKKRVKDAHRKPRPDKFPRSPEFIERCDELLTACAKFHTVATHWRGREVSVKLFGH